MTGIVLAALAGLGILAIDCASIARKRRRHSRISAVHIWTCLKVREGGR